VKEQEKGRTIEGKYGDYVYLDVRHLGQKKIDKKIPFVRDTAKNYIGIDPVHEPIPVRPVVHYMMGGVDTDIDGATSLPGLFAAGECACVSINGANRLGSNSLTELLVFGRRAARAAAAFAVHNPAVDEDAIRKQAAEEEKRIRSRFLERTGGSETIADIRTDMNTTFDKGAGIYRNEAALKETCATVLELKKRFGEIKLTDRTRAFNTELQNALELEFMLDAGEALAFSAVARTESRGSHQRTDHPERNDEDFLKHSLAYRTDGEPRIDYKDVVITRWPPGERVYGKR
jgi:fumarate reductase flavoprotein subunit